MSESRTIAATILSQIQVGRNTLDQLLDQAGNQIQRLSRSDRALVHALVYGVLRWQNRLDWIIDQLAVKNKKMDPTVRIILRLGLFQLQFLHRIPPSAAVNTSVELAKKCDRKWAAGFVNGLLRQAIRQADAIKWPDPAREPVEFLSAAHSFPGWMISRWLDRWGYETTVRLCSAVNTIPAVTLRTNTLQVPRQTLQQAVASAAESVRETRYSPEGLILEHLLAPLPQWPAFENGWFQVQGEAAQIISHYLDARPGEKIWDACAGLGTKTAHMAELMRNQGEILATDLYPDKLRQLDADMRRLGITIVKSSPLDLTRPDQIDLADKFDRILLDAPCSGLGVLQKNPDGKWRIRPEDIQANGRRQLALLHNCARHLKTGGILVYAVCSLEPEENNKVVDEFLLKHPEFAIRHSNLGAVGEAERLLTPEGFLTTIPHLHLMDGFFAAAMVKTVENRAAL